MSDSYTPLPRSKVLLIFMSSEAAELFHRSLHVSFPMCIDFVSLFVKNQGVRFFVRFFGDIQHKADKLNRFSINFFLF